MWSHWTPLFNLLARRENLSEGDLLSFLQETELGQPKLKALYSINFPITFLLRGRQNRRYFFDKKDIPAKGSRLDIDLKEVMQQTGQKVFITPDDKRFSDGLYVIKDELDKIASFFKGCVYTRNDLVGLLSSISDFLNKINQSSQLEFCFKYENGSARVHCPKFTKMGAETLEDAIEHRYILLPFFEIGVEVFQKVVICEQCGCFFVAKSSRAKFCTDICRVKFNKKLRLQER